MVSGAVFGVVTNNSAPVGEIEAATYATPLMEPVTPS